MTKSIGNKNHDYIFLKSKQKVSENILSALKSANVHYSKTKKFSTYKKKIQQIFKLKSITKITSETKCYFAGFVEGEGSLNVGIKQNNKTQFKLYVDPEFNITQHINGISNFGNDNFSNRTNSIQIR